MEEQTTSEKPNGLATSILVQYKLAEAGIILCEPSNEKATLENGFDFFRKELLKRSETTVILFTHYCLGPMREVLLKTNLIKPGSESVSFATIVMMITGYMQAGFTTKIDSIPNKNYLKFVTTLPTLFEPNEIEDIIACLKLLLSEFPEKAEGAIKWLEEDIEPQKNQLNVLKEFVNLLQKGGKVKNDEEFKKVSQKVIDTCMPGGPDNDHNLYTIKARERFGLHPPDKQLIVSIDRILTYLDVLSYAGFFPDGLPKKAMELNFLQKSF